MFVDNKSLLHNGMRWDTPAPELMNIVTGDLSLWDRYIWTTGGLPERLKMEYSPLIWKFKVDGKPAITHDNKLLQNTVVIHRHGFDTAVKHITTTKASEIMGIHQAINRQEKTELSCLKKKITTFIKALQTSYTSLSNTWTLYKTALLSIFGYSLPALSITQDRATDLELIYMQELKIQTGYSTKYPNALLFSTTHHMGAGFKRMHALHTAARIKYLSKHIRANTYQGKTAQAMI
eukprot:2767358-Ditylum_brightwellii.AAC.1